MTMTVIYSTLVLSLITCLIVLAIATSCVRDKPAVPTPVKSAMPSIAAALLPGRSA